MTFGGITAQPWLAAWLPAVGSLLKHEGLLWQILPAKAVVRLSGGGISSDDCGNDGDRLHSMLWLCGNGQTQGEAGGGLHNRMSYGGLILGGTEDGSISCWTVPQEVTDLLPHRTSGLDWPQSGGGEVLRVGTPAQGTRDGIAQGNGA